MSTWARIKLYACAMLVMVPLSGCLALLRGERHEHDHRDATPREKPAVNPAHLDGSHRDQAQCEQYASEADHDACLDRLGY